MQGEGKINKEVMFTKQNNRWEYNTKIRKRDGLAKTIKNYNNKPINGHS